MALMALGILARQMIIEAPSSLIEDLTVIFPTAHVVLEAERADLILRELDGDRWVIEEAGGSQTIDLDRHMGLICGCDQEIGRPRCCEV